MYCYEEELPEFIKCPIKHFHLRWSIKRYTISMFLFKICMK